MAGGNIMAKKRSATQTKRTIQAKTVVKIADEPKEKTWFGMQRWVVAVLGIGILILLFAPLFSVTKIISKTETVMTTVTTQEPVTVISQNKIKVYVGWLKTTEQSGAGTTYGYYYPVPIVINSGGSLPGTSGGYTMAQQQQQQTYTGYSSGIYNYGGTQTTSTTKVDPSDQIVDVKYASAPNNCWDVTLISHDGAEKIIRDVNEYDLTKTGDTTVDVTETKMNTVINEVPQQVTKEVPVQVRVSLFQLIFGNY
jgi:hypothetical protein